MAGRLSYSFPVITLNALEKYLNYTVDILWKSDDNF